MPRHDPTPPGEPTTPSRRPWPHRVGRWAWNALAVLALLQVLGVVALVVALPGLLSTHGDRVLASVVADRIGEGGEVEVDLEVGSVLDLLALRARSLELDITGLPLGEAGADVAGDAAGSATLDVHVEASGIDLDLGTDGGASATVASGRVRISGDVRQVVGAQAGGDVAGSGPLEVRVVTRDDGTQHLQVVPVGHPPVEVELPPGAMWQAELDGDRLVLEAALDDVRLGH